MMQIKHVKIMKSSGFNYWYADKINQEFYVHETKNMDEWNHQVLHVGSFNSERNKQFIKDSDFKVISVFDGEYKVHEKYEGEILQNITISIKNNSK